MTTTSIITNENEVAIKQSHMKHSCYRVNTCDAYKHVTIPETNISKQDFHIERKKYRLNESESLKEYRMRSLTHWPHFQPNSTSMASAGWFSCNNKDRTICIYCNKMCHYWTTNDDPAEVHRRLSPKCPFVLSMTPTDISPKIINDTLKENCQPSHPKMTEMSQREATFSNLNSKENLPSVEDIVRAGFFYSGVSNTVTCFFCNGSLHNWGSKDNPMIEHARWFPHCNYIKNLCGNDLFGRIQDSKMKKLLENNIDENELRRLVISRLDLPFAEHLRSQYSLSIIKRCIEDQFKINNNDFKCDTDLSIACLVLKSQVNIIENLKENIIIPSKYQQSNDASVTSKESLGECFICLTEEKVLSCMPCGHLCACVPCGYALKSCPICRAKIQSLIRVSL